jgi:hypothetical protein
LDDFRKIVDNTKDKSLTIDAYKPPYGAYVDLAYLYASTCNAQSQKIEMRDFVTACHKFGIDSPFPCVYSKELALSNDMAIYAKTNAKPINVKNGNKNLSTFALGAQANQNK